MSEPDSTPRRRPPTIDLTATEIETERPPHSAGAADAGGDSGEEKVPPQSAAAIFGGGSLPLAMAAGAGVIVTAAIFIGLWFAGVVSSHNPPSATDVQETNSPGAAEIAAQLARIQAELQAQRPQTGLTTRLATIEAEIKALGDTLAALNRRLDDATLAARNALDRANAAEVAAKSDTRGGVQRSDLDALANRIASLESSVKNLSEDAARRTASAPDRLARAVLAAEALRANVERGAPFTAELAAVKSFGADPSATAALAPFAADGIPTAAELAHQLALLTPSLAKASEAAPNNDDSFLGRLANNAKGLVRITPVGTPAGDDPAAIVARLNTDAARNDIAAALADIPHLPEAAKSLAGPWVQKAKARDAAIAAGRRIVAAALAGLGDTSTQ